MKIALIGDYSKAVIAHRAIDAAIALEADTYDGRVSANWLHSGTLRDVDLDQYDAAWAVPASPYADMDNIITAIRYFRETGKPFLGTCGGYQHALIEYAQNALNHPQAGLTEVDPDCPMPLVSTLSCALIEEMDTVIPEPGGLIERICGEAPLQETYHCSFGLNPDYAYIFEGTDLRVAARAKDGAIRAMALADHRFFLGTAFQPERAGLHGARHPIIRAFVNAIQTG